MVSRYWQPRRMANNGSCYLHGTEYHRRADNVAYASSVFLDTAGLICERPSNLRPGFPACHDHHV